jgi:uncharacterized membrane protein
VNASSATSDVSDDSGVIHADHTVAAVEVAIVLVGMAAGTARLGIVVGAASSLRIVGIVDVGP